MNRIISAWRGEERLWKVFWVYGLLMGIALSIALNIIVKIAVSSFFPAYASHRELIAILCLMPYTIWIYVSHWRCAFNAAWKVWGYIIRFFVVLGIILVAFQIFLAANPSADTALNRLQQCAEEQADYMKQGGKDTAGFLKQCLEKKKAGNAPAPQAVTVPLAAGNADSDKVACEQIMTDHAKKSGADPKQYIAQNQAYLQQCITYQRQKAAGGQN